MRNLTIQRVKSKAACMVSMKVYIEDAASEEITINGVNCRKLGELKNGEEKTFPISENSGKVFVIAGTTSKDYCNDFYELPAGTEDVHLSGRNKLNPGNGNAFRFDGNDGEAVQQHRKKGTRKGIIVLIVALLLGTVVGTMLGLHFVSDKKEQIR